MIINKKIIAREWLVFFSLLVFGFFFMPQFSERSYTSFFYDLFRSHVYHTSSISYYSYGTPVYSYYTIYWYETWATLLIPYIIIQVIRSLIWAFSNLFTKKNITK